MISVYVMPSADVLTHLQPSSLLEGLAIGGELVQVISDAIKPTADVTLMVSLSSALQEF